jgi:protein TonB
MPPTAKDLDVATSRSPSPAGVSGTGKSQPVALEIPVTVNGARTVEGSDKREPFAETTQTVLVFGNGAVIRLASTVTPGQLLFLTNEKTKKEVVCQVLKSKNYSNVSGYVELEFTETVSGFWGVRFVAEGASRPSAPATAQGSAPVATAPKAQVPATAPATTNLPKPAPPAAPVSAAKTETVTTSALKAEGKSPATLPRAGETTSALTLPKPPALPNSRGGSVITTSSRAPEVKAPAPPPAQAPTTPANSQVHVSGEALKRESARLQEQLSAMLFSSDSPAATQSPAVNKPASGDPVSKVIEMAKPQPPTAKTTAPTKSSGGMEADQVKIPSWLEPLARNAATPAQNELTTEARESDDGIEYEVQELSAAASSQQVTVLPDPEPVLDLPVAHEIFGRERRPAKNKMTLIGGAAAGFLVLAAGTTWYLRQAPSASSQAAVTAAAPNSATAVPPVTKSAADLPTGSPGNAGGNFSSTASNSLPTGTSAVSSQPTTPTAQPLKGAPDRVTTAELSAYKKLAEPQPPPALQPQPRKSSLGEVRLAAPSAVRRPAAPETGGVELAPSIGHLAPTGDALGGGLAAGGSKPVAPAAPLPVGGDVKQAKLISSTPPVYPPLAKTQHVEGNVRIDALVDENGKVSSMKVVSGPTLLHQAAMDSIRQWKYQPATLDGKAVPMHLTVTLQFRLQ